MSSPSHLDIRQAEEDKAARQAYKEEEIICWSAGPILLNNQPIMGSALGNHPDKASAAVRALVKDSTLDDKDLEDDAPSAANHAHLKTRQMKDLDKRKRKFTRNLKGPSSKNPDQKNSNFDYAAFGQDKEMQASENAQQVHAAISPAKARSPLSKVKKDQTALRIHLELSTRKQTLLSAKCHRNKEKIVNLKRINNQLMVDLLEEKQASNKIIDEAMVEAHQLSAKALDMMTTAHKIHADAEVRIMNEQSRTTTLLLQEHAHSAGESARLWEKLVTTINKLNREQESSINQLKFKSNKKYEKVRYDVMMLSSKLKDQYITWQKRLNDLDYSSKNLVSKERRAGAILYSSNSTKQPLLRANC
jgi:hypothetical protein